MPSRKFWIFTLILMQFGGFWVQLHDSFTLMDCQRGVTRHPGNPPSDAYDYFFINLWPFVMKFSEAFQAFEITQTFVPSNGDATYMDLHTRFEIFKNK